MDVSQSIEYLKLLRERAAVEEFPHLASDDAFFSAEERAFFTRHIETSTTQQIQAIQHAIELSQDTSRWWKDLYLKYLTKSYNWCETFRILFNPKPSHLGLTFSRFPTQTAHISHKGVYQQ